jgi:hypothetical protein
MTAPLPPHQLDERAQRLEQLVQRTQQAVLVSVEEILRRQMEPFLEHTRRTLLATVEEMVRKYADPLLAQTRGATLQTVEEMLKRQIEPFLERARHMVLEGLENAGFVQRYVDVLAVGLKSFARETAVEVFQVQLPAYSHQFGRRLLGYAVGGTLLCLAVIFLLVGGIWGLQAAGVPAYVTYLAGGVAAAAAAVVLFKVTSRSPTVGERGA